MGAVRILQKEVADLKAARPIRLKLDELIAREEDEDVSKEVDEKIDVVEQAEENKRRNNNKKKCARSAEHIFNKKRRLVFAPLGVRTAWCSHRLVFAPLGVRDCLVRVKANEQVTGTRSQMAPRIWAVKPMCEKQANEKVTGTRSQMAPGIRAVKPMCERTFN